MIPGGYQPGILGFYKKLKVNAHNKGISKIGTPANAQLWHIMRPPFTLPQSAKGFPYWKKAPCRGRILQGMSFFLGPRRPVGQDLKGKLGAECTLGGRAFSGIKGIFLRADSAI